MPRRRALLAAALALPAPALAARELADATGRRVPVPARVARVFPAGPPAAILAYTLAPDLLAGWPARPPRPHEAAFLDPAAAALPAIRRLTGRDNAATPEAVLAQRPDIVLDYGSVAPAFTQLAERVQAQTGIPTLLLDGAPGKIPETYLQLGDMLDRPREAAERAGVADVILLSARQAAARLGARGRPRVFYAGGPHGTRTGLRGSIATEILQLAGAENVAVGPPGPAEVSPEQVLAWDPDWIIARDPAFLRHAQADPVWRAARAVRQGRLVLAPGAPFGWVDAPPAVNRLLGLMWLPALFGVVPADVLPERIEAFHRMFYHRRPTAGQVKGLLADAFPRA